MDRLFRKLKRFLHLRNYTYGFVFNQDGSKHCRARLSKSNNNVEFVLWKAGEQGHKTNYWQRMGCGWITLFKSDLKIGQDND